MTFDAAAVDALFSALTSKCKALSIFQKVDAHEPENAPGNRLYCSVLLGPLKPLQSSGLSSISGQVTFTIRVWSKAMQRPLDKIDPEVLAAAAKLIAALAGDFELGGLVRNIDVFSMTATPAWAEWPDNTQFRVVDVAVPCVINDMFEEVA